MSGNHTLFVRRHNDKVADLIVYWDCRILLWEAMMIRNQNFKSILGKGIWNKGPRIIKLLPKNWSCPIKKWYSYYLQKVLQKEEKWKQNFWMLLQSKIILLVLKWWVVAWSQTHIKVIAWSQCISEADWKLNLSNHPKSRHISQ